MPVVSPLPAAPAERAQALPMRSLVDIAAGLASTATQWPEQPAAEHRERTGVRLLLTPEYDAWLLRWPPGTRVTPHDHGDSVGAFCVVEGELYEQRWPWGPGDLVRRVSAGETVTLPRGVVHDVIAGAELALSVHVYSPPLADMGFYDDGGQLVDRLAVAELAPAGDSRGLHPAVAR